MRIELKTNGITISDSYTYKAEFYEPIMLKVIVPGAYVPVYYIVMPNYRGKFQAVGLSEGFLGREYDSIQECVKSIGNDYTIVEDGWKSCVLAAQYQDGNNKYMDRLNEWCKR